MAIVCSGIRGKQIVKESCPPEDMYWDGVWGLPIQRMVPGSAISSMSAT